MRTNVTDSPHMLLTLRHPINQQARARAPRPFSATIAASSIVQVVAVLQRSAAPWRPPPTVGKTAPATGSAASRRQSAYATAGGRREIVHYGHAPGIVTAMASAPKPQSRTISVGPPLACLRARVCVRLCERLCARLCVFARLRASF